MNDLPLTPQAIGRADDDFSLQPQFLLVFGFVLSVDLGFAGLSLSGGLARDVSFFTIVDANQQQNW